MATATLIDRDVISFAGPANSYRLDPPLSGHEFVTVFIEPGYGSVAPRAAVVPKRLGDEPMLNAPLPGSFSLQGETSIDDAAWFALLAAGGYEIVSGFDGVPVAADVTPVVDEPKLFERTMRVYEVAYKLEVPSARIIEALEALGVEGKTPNSNVEPADALRVRDYLNEVT